MSDIDLGAIEARVNAATEGPWASSSYDVETVPAFDLHRFDTMPLTVAWARQTEADANFIAHTRTDVPALVAKVRELEATVARVEALADEGDALAAEIVGSRMARNNGRAGTRDIRAALKAPTP